MPPVYVYENPDGERIEVVRKIKDSDVPPTEEETKGKKGPWGRIIAEGISVTKGNNWGKGKGSW